LFDVGLSIGKGDFVRCSLRNGDFSFSDIDSVVRLSEMDSILLDQTDETWLLSVDVH
jgi:hypothetical protein